MKLPRPSRRWRFIIAAESNGRIYLPDEQIRNGSRITKGLDGNGDSIGGPLSGGVKHAHQNLLCSCPAGSVVSATHFAIDDGRTDGLFGEKVGGRDGIQVQEGERGFEL